MRTATELARFRLRASGRMGMRRHRSGWACRNHRGRAGGFLAEKEPASVPKLGLGVIPRCLGGGQPKVRNLVFVKEVLYAIIDAQVHHVPIIQPRPLHCPVADVKAQGADQMQAGAGGCRGACNVSGVLRDLGFHQN